MIDASTPITDEPSTLKNIASQRQQFPTLQQTVNDKPLVYLDSAASAHKPHLVIKRTEQFYSLENAAVHRGIHHLSAQATDAMETVRTQSQRFLNAKEREEIIFVHGTTHGINLVANTYGRSQWHQGDEIIVTEMGITPTLSLGRCLPMISVLKWSSGLLNMMAH